MRKLILLIGLVFLSWNSFSQIDTAKDSIVQLKVPIAKLVIKDLLKGDGVKLELAELKKQIELLREKINLKDSLVTTLNTKTANLQTVIETKDQQFKLQQELSDKLHKELKAQKRTTFIYKAGAVVGALATTVLILRQ